MKVLIISYSLTGNNSALARALSAEFSAEHIKIAESKTRTMFTIVLDMIFNRTPAVNLNLNKLDNRDLIVFVAPVWMGQVASPLRACFRYLKNKPGNYAFVSISGGADDVNPKLEAELKKRTGKAPAAIIDLHITDLLPKDPKPDRETTSAYRINEKDVKILTERAAMALRQILPK